MKVLAIIPCAGYGTRMNMKPNESKELLIDPVNNKPLIEYTLDICKQYDLEPIIVLRSGKIDLINYCKLNNVNYFVNDVPGEWNHSIMSVKDLWHDKNIVLLPDTRFDPISAIENVIRGLNAGKDTSLALHHVEDRSKWGSIMNDYTLEEKPDNMTSGVAWGILGFEKSVGEDIFSNKVYRLYNSSHVYLKSFKDITRTGKLI